MEERIQKIREIAKRLLKDKAVDVVIGYAKGSEPLKCRPFFARTPEQADQLVWDHNGRINLANFLPKRKDKVAIVAKGCDARNVVNHIVENQVKRDQVYIIGVPCLGMIEPAKVRQAEPRPLTGATESGGKLVLTGAGFETTLNVADLMRDNCLACAHRNPPLADEMVVPEVPEAQDVDRYADIDELAAKSGEERYAHFTELIEKCIRCYACRDACPLCYCPVCFVDEHMPQWVGKSNDPRDVMTYHQLRAFHCAGRCTDCGACEAACPMDIKVRQFTRRLEKDVKEFYGYEAGLDPDKQPPLTVFRPDDPQDFIK